LHGAPLPPDFAAGLATRATMFAGLRGIVTTVEAGLNPIVVMLASADVPKEAQ